MKKDKAAVPLTFMDNPKIKACSLELKRGKKLLAEATNLALAPMTKNKDHASVDDDFGMSHQKVKQLTQALVPKSYKIHKGVGSRRGMS
ncbi:hypothetical protein Tco_0115778 [Tanacetum coccineum]